MADTKNTALTENTAPLGSDLAYLVDDPNGSPLSQKIYKGSDNLLPDGYMINGKLSVTVTGNNLTVALKTKSGGNPSATDPVSVWINGTFRRCTAALSVTKNAGTNWCNSGSAELATKEVDYFVYFIWNTTPATDILDIGFARIPYGRVYSDFSGTSTNEKYLAFANASTPTSTDDCAVVGRFAATLSAGAGYTWSISGTGDVINRPIFETDVLDFNCTVTHAGGTTDPTSNTINTAKYSIQGRDFRIHLRSTLVRGTGNRTVHTFTLPWTAWVEDTSPANAMTSITAAGIASCTGYMSGATFVFYNVTMANNGTYYGTGINTMS